MGRRFSAENFTNLGAVGDRTCFHKNVNGMWLLRQCMEEWGASWEIQELGRSGGVSGEAGRSAGGG